VSEKQKRKYTEDEEDSLVLMYGELGTKGIPEIAAFLGRTEKSVIAKLAIMDLYTPVPKEPVDKGYSKKELLIILEDLVGFDTSGFYAAKKESLEALIQHLNPEFDPRKPSS